MKTLIVILLMAFVSLTAAAQTAAPAKPAPGSRYSENVAKLKLGEKPASFFSAPFATLKIVEERINYNCAVDIGQSSMIYKWFTTTNEKGEEVAVTVFNVPHALTIMWDLGYKPITHSMEVAGGLTVHYYTFEKLKK